MCDYHMSFVYGTFCQIKRTFCHEHVCPQIILYIESLVSKQLYGKCVTNVHHDGRIRSHQEYFHSLTNSLTHLLTHLLTSTLTYVKLHLGRRLRQLAVEGEEG